VGLDYRYLLYFECRRLWDALEGVAEMGEDYGHRHAVIRFPDREVSVRLEPWASESGAFDHDAPELRFACSLRFKEDAALLDYRGTIDGSPELRVITAPDGSRELPVGYIYLTVRTDLETDADAMGPVRFEFGTTGTRMSLLFDESPSIRRAFVGLLERYGGICGLFDREMGDGELFWFKGRQLSEEIPDIDMAPHEIEALIDGA
jgi:hypothetical protein